MNRAVALLLVINCNYTIAADPEFQQTLDRFVKAKPDAKAMGFYSLDWSPNLKEALVRAKQEHRPVFLIANTNITAGCNFYTGHT